MQRTPSKTKGSSPNHQLLGVDYVLLKFTKCVDLQQKHGSFMFFFLGKNRGFAQISGKTMGKRCEVYGGVPKKEQLPAVRAGAPILVATPGRLNDFLECLG